jgi:DNA-binding NarL/FixJ family response regulator
VAEDAPVVVAGVEAILRAAGSDLTPVPLDGARHGAPPPDVVLYDPHRGVPDGLGPVSGRPGPTMIAFSWAVGDDVAMRARAQGAAGLLSKDLPIPRLLAAIRAIHAGDRLDYTVTVADGPDTGRSARRPDGLTAREVEMLELITQGLSNDEIARTLYLSINSVKTYIRTAYRKIGVTRRPQAVLWGVHHGFAADPPRPLSG